MKTAVTRARKIAAPRHPAPEPHASRARSETLRRAALSGTLASITATIALVLLARREGRGAFQPLNATSHWLNGSKAADVTQLDLRHTGVGYATHHAATLFWAVLFESALGSRRPLSLPRLLGEGIVLSAVAAAVDYGATPRRFTPGWEFVLSRQAMAVAYAAMAAGLIAGTAHARRRKPSRNQPARAMFGA